MSDIPTSRKLPIKAEDGDQILTGEGYIYEYNAEDDVWVYKGQLVDPPIVDATQNGLITPEMFEKLELIDKLRDGGYDFSQFKIYANSANPYYYFWYSADDLIRFYPETKSTLRLEIDKRRLYQKLMRNCCVGPKGPDGFQGVDGRDGIVVASEIFRDPVSYIDGIYEIRVAVPTPLDTPISTRIYGSAQLCEIFYYLDGTIEVTINDDEILIGDVALSYEDGILVGIIKFTAGQDKPNQFKSRQVGSTGRDGTDGLPFLVVQEQAIDDSAVRSTDAILTLRKSNVLNNIVYHKAAIYEKICAHRLKIRTGELPMGGFLDTKFLAVVPTSDSCKNICYFQFDTCANLGGTTASASSLLNCDIEPAIKVDPLELPHWTPTKSCIDRARFDQLQFDWYKLTDYAFKILKDPMLLEQCCQQDFFWCPNVGEEPCEIGGKIEAPQRSLGKKCPCPCPEETEDDLIADGVLFPELDTNTAGGYNVPATHPEHPLVGHNDEDEWVRECNVTNDREAQVISDRRLVPDLYIQPVGVGSSLAGLDGGGVAAGGVISEDFGQLSKVIITFGLLNPDHLCPDTPGLPGYEDPCNVRTRVIAEVTSGSVVVLPSLVMEKQLTPTKEEETFEFWVGGQGAVDFKIYFNTDEIFCCRSYYIWTRITPSEGLGIDIPVDIDNINIPLGIDIPIRIAEGISIGGSPMGPME